jgi:MFS family permease
MAIIGVLIANTCALLITSPLLYFSVFIFTFLSLYCFGMASNNIIMEFAPRVADTPLYTSVYNLVMALPRSAAPLLGGVIAQQTHDYRILFATAMVLAVTGLTLTMRTSEPRKVNAERASEEANVLNTAGRPRNSEEACLPVSRACA